MWTFTNRDVLRNKLVEPGWYTLKILSIGEAPSKDGGSTNSPVEAEIVRSADNGSVEFAGVPIDWNFNSKAMGFAIGFLASFIDPVTGKGIEVKPGERVDPRAAEGLEIDVFIKRGEYNGRQKNEAEHQYRPATKVA